MNNKKQLKQDRELKNAAMRRYVAKRKQEDPDFKAQLALYQREWRERKAQSDPSFPQQRRDAAKARYRRLKKDTSFLEKMAAKTAASRAKQMAADPEGLRQRTREAHQRRLFKKKLIKAFTAFLTDFMRSHRP